MSDIYKGKKYTQSAGINVYVDTTGSNIDRATKLLAGISGGIDKAIHSAMNRAATAGEAEAAKSIRKHYVIRVSDFKERTTSKKTLTESSGGIDVDITFAGQHISLVKFDTKISADGRVYARVKRDSTKKAFEHAFFAEMKSGHQGIFERIGSKSLPIREILGPSTPQMLSANDTVKEEVAKKIEKTFDDRLDHEILRVLNGWGV